NGNVEKRVEQECHELNVKREIVWRDAVVTERRGIDKMIHRYLVEHGFQIQQFDKTGQDTEWIKCTVADVEKAFAVVKEKLYNEDKRKELSQKFYEELRNWYFWATEESKNPDYTLRIIIRLLLCFFLKEKGLIPVCLFDENYVKENLKENEYRYHKVIIRNLFFYSLNTPKNERGELENRNLIQHHGKIKEQLHKNIPFLNGGLFTEHSGDDFLLNDDYFFSAPRTKTIKELGGKYSVAGIIHILAQYKYTLEETDNSEFIDPEFIGKMFESLLACIDADSKESRRKVTGSYYTPREIVDYMVNESLDAYLTNSKNIDNDTNIESMIFRCQILDPACGSGAFPCGIMNAVMQRLDPDKKLPQSKRYQKKLKILRNVIYGVDIQPMAVQIAMLRLFLSLLQEIQLDPKADNFGIESLPNLDYKFVAANTLMGIDCNGLFFNVHKDLFHQILRLKQDYFTESDVLSREQLKKQIRNAEQELAQLCDSEDIKVLCAWNHSDTAASPYFDARWMFGVEKFDIVIGNPPYGATYPAEQKKYFKEHYVSAKTIANEQKGSIDTFSLFIENGFNVLKTGGYLNFIVPLTITSGDSMTGLHKLLLNNCETIKVVSFCDRPLQIFKNSHKKTSIISFCKNETPCSHLLMTQMYRWHGGITQTELLSTLKFTEGLKYRLNGRFPKISFSIERRILKKLFSCKTNIGLLQKNTGKPIYYRTSGGMYYNVITNYSTESTQEKALYFDAKIAEVVGAVLSSNLFWWYQQVYSDNLHIKVTEIESFPIPVENLKPKIIEQIEKLFAQYLRDIQKNIVEHKTTEYVNVNSYKEYKIRYSKRLIDLIDDVICPLYGLTDKERDFIKNYELSFRVNK
ncbi:MAG: N-6 DNA methylase, partial [Planctomycetaceae bacterium]|nr:N-6 DNA methylase [Planctomycetaceae bacterium]